VVVVVEDELGSFARPNYAALYGSRAGHCSVLYQRMAGSNFVGNLRLADVESGAEELAG